MPYSAFHKARTRERILDAARRAFARVGYEAVTIDEVMRRAGLTRGGFYNHFRHKADLFAAAVESYGTATPWQDAKTSGSSANGLARWFIDFYLSDDMLANVEIGCPLYGFPNDIARAGSAPRHAYTRLIERTAAIFEAALGSEPDAAERAEAILSLCVGAMLLASTTESETLRVSIRRSARRTALELLDS
ncbi:TetR/AcrR family transcriptional regulator [Sphingopyxis sp. JAI128]|uniref:TetR/AcrR family transcriptional regulator n=1 Tax=Sphingopyxis sp. JAI128 TaxID=2723066 RepID=UPI00160F2554|nr:TetR/AcrR family transcriptional regulator [Sphingopyxis sp. JAI128]MBB6426945.1 AcrR family transcriptional regulator [Sphingopyxis sp. JAI128]